MKFSRIDQKWFRVTLHIAAWAVLLSLPFLLRPAYDERVADPNKNGIFYLTLATGFFWMLLFYLNVYVLTPLVLYKKRYIAYIFAALASYGVILFFHGLFFKALIHDREFKIFRSAGFNLTTFLLTIAASIIYRMMADKSKADRLAQQQQQETLKSELSFLRSQISPHFIFNVLNNMVALVRMKSDQLEPTIIRLSSLMQYMLYETDEEKVMLGTEAQYLRSYIELQQQRFGKKLRLETSLEISDESYAIEPMLLIPFVENAFKHGVGMIEKPEIHIHLETRDTKLLFTVKNKFNDQVPETKDKTSGIGLSNVTRRLNLLYGNQHELMITRKDGWFSVSLQINLHK